MNLSQGTATSPASYEVSQSALACRLLQVILEIAMGIRISTECRGLLAFSKSTLLSASCCALFCVPGAFAGDPTEYNLGSDITIQQAAAMLHYTSGNDRLRIQAAPKYSEELGWSVLGATGGYITDAMALGLIVEYGDNKREYLANAGLQITDALSLVGTVGLLEEHNEYFYGEGRKKVQQMEYGVSLKGAYEPGFLSGFELNGYLADADADSYSAETGKLYGVQLLSNLSLTDLTQLKIGGGYEWLEWDDTNEDDSHWTINTQAIQQIGDALSLTGQAKIGASEYVYGGGLAFDLSDGGVNSNVLGVNYSFIDGKNGIQDDKRVEVSWTIGFGSGGTSNVAAADMTDKSGQISPAADVVLAAPANNLLSDVLKRPSYLPERVLARAEATTCPFSVVDIGGFKSLTYVSSYPPSGNSYVRISSTTQFTADQLSRFTFSLGSSTLVSVSGSGALPFSPVEYATALLFEPTTGDDKIFTARADGYSCSFVLDDYL